jgi:hypothetical protein
MQCFIKVPILAELEKNNQWENARQLLYDIWIKNSNNADYTCRVIAECWYVLSEWDCSIQTSSLSYAKFKNTLIEATTDGLKKFYENEGFLWLVGYMIKLFPYLFYDEENNGLYQQWEDLGQCMINKATIINSDNPISKLLLMGFQPISKEFLSAKKDFIPMIDQYFCNDTAIERYFKEILVSELNM